MRNFGYGEAGWGEAPAAKTCKSWHDQITAGQHGDEPTKTTGETGANLSIRSHRRRASQAPTAKKPILGSDHREKLE
jgi:hypothetical protein